MQSDKKTTIVLCPGCINYNQRHSDDVTEKTLKEFPGSTRLNCHCCGSEIKDKFYVLTLELIVVG